MSRGKDHKNYIKSKVDYFLKDFSLKAVRDKPLNLYEYLLSYLKETSGLKLSESEQEELRSLRKIIENHHKGKGSSSESESEDDEIDEIPIPSNKMLRTSRLSVSAEVFGMWNKKEDFTPRKIQKSPENTLRLTQILEKSFMFSALDREEMTIVADAMELRTFDPNSIVISQGDDGNELFVIDSGKLECTKTLVPGDPPVFLKNYHAEEVFGELALLYNSPRAATIKSLTECKCWVLDRNTFIYIVKDAAMRKREKYENFLNGIEILKNIDAYERMQIADALKTVSFNAGEYVIRQGDWGDIFYIVEYGTAIAKKCFFTGGPEIEVKSYGPGDYFGELSLIKGEPRAASIIATSSLKCASLNRKAFQRMLGPLDEILRRNALNYANSPN